MRNCAAATQAAKAESGFVCLGLFLAERPCVCVVWRFGVAVSVVWLFGEVDWWSLIAGARRVAGWVLLAVTSPCCSGMQSVHSPCLVD